MNTDTFQVLRLIARDPGTLRLASCVSDDGGKSWTKLIDAGGQFPERQAISNDPRQWPDRCWQNFQEEEASK